MRKPIDIPIIAVGPGSQPIEDEALEYMAMPKEMFTHDLVSLPESEELRDRTRVRDLFDDLLATTRAYSVGDKGIAHDLSQLDAADLDCLNQILGVGEVSVTLDLPGDTLLAQESVLTGIWRVRQIDAAQTVLDDHLEVGDVPHAVRSSSFGAAPGTALLPGAPIPGVQNAPALLVEIAEKMSTWTPGDQAHVINLTLLPLTREDLIHLGSELGVGPATILSRGYGNCRIGATRMPNVWWVKYFNSQDALILNTIEIVDVPAVALAAQEDLADTADRLHEILALFQ
ncbi:MAG: hydrogenase expression/formation C-terminal domain-containing protein [Thiomonas sp.]|jgi:hydrogenase-1 operon protein HyaF|uniref:HupH hydrogenase expression protein n=1 Tax=Thiomonas intermedia (strain K12) TaxID=75379 RepID=D5WZY2_THIK1|nr:hydrogenase expression/formation C-terminal domain-containing protein [Thiomonas arsenitoxydans]MDE2130625.1 hydrogenase expression/formation protein [Betaproteobacteria bacterium]